jgi:hypothetical protein
MENNVIVLMIRASTQLPMYGQQYTLFDRHQNDARMHLLD